LRFRPHTVCGMESVLGGGVLLAVAAALWLVYLVPNWLRRSEYLATERNAVRLQQTIRVLAETAETPEAVRLETAAKARALEANLRRQQRPGAVGAPATLQDPSDPRLLAATRMRRARIGTTVAIVIAALVLVAQLVVALVAGVAAISLAAVLFAGGFFVAGLWLQGRLIRAQRAAARRAHHADGADHRGAVRVNLVGGAGQPVPAGGGDVLAERQHRHLLLRGQPADPVRH